MSTSLGEFQEQISLGAAVPALTCHAISVSLPTWEDSVGYKKGDRRVLESMTSGYPRNFIQLNICKLSQICERMFGTKGEQAMLFPSRAIADKCRAFIIDRACQQNSEVLVRLEKLLVTPKEHSASTDSGVNIHIVLFPIDKFPLAKQFWQHTGLGISSRLAERCLSVLADTSKSGLPAIPPDHLAKRIDDDRVSAQSRLLDEEASESLIPNYVTYLEDRRDCNLPTGAAKSAKRAIRRRIAALIVRTPSNDLSCAGGHHTTDSLLSNPPDIEEVSEEDIYLYPTGMAAVWYAHQLVLGTMSSVKSICFGFPFTDTLKILEKWGPGCHFFGHGLDKDIDDLEALLERELNQHPDVSLASALFTEFPSNPLLRSADLPRLRALADKHHFLLIVDETLGNFANVEVLSYADVVVSSLTKVFSGAANVMGGSLVLNPKGHYYSILKAHLSQTYEDTYFDEDAIYMEYNSRNFLRRVQVIDANAEAVCDYLSSHTDVVKQVFYPKYTTPDQYNKCRVPGGGYGGVCSLTFHDMRASKAFFDALPCPKGPTLGTNFTLALPYVIIAHYAELDWAAEYGVEVGLVRISVGMENREVLMQWLDHALKAARVVARTAEATVSSIIPGSLDECDEAH